MLGADKGGGADFLIIIGAEEITDFAIGHAESMLKFSGHGEQDRADGIAGDANGIGNLFGMSALAIVMATAAIAGLDIELGDDGHDGRQIGLKLCDRAAIIQWRRTIGALF